ncbi:hypothetical protein EK403_15375 [Hansschlegelia zhihuaiae]|uniref:Uncharacterized protein n=1 Tax=Hansschlegelia zhihuaiae TaxID=405005 RepID=A0A4Q0ME83_9HYPH|nr:hypothetical protein EK403_15375 [Hansschlegelia zhihuaiae]
MPPMRFRFRRGRVTVDDGQSAGAACLVEFDDGVTVIAAWDHAGDAIQLSVPAYRTAKGPRVLSRRWRTAQSDDGSWRSERIW